MYREYLKFWNEKRLHRAKEINLTPIEVSILASVVNKESSKIIERPFHCRSIYESTKKRLSSSGSHSHFFNKTKRE